jgi:hypothetical protein
MERTKGLLTARGDHSSLPPPLAPVLLVLPLHRQGVRVLHLEPIGRAAATIARVFALRHDAFERVFKGGNVSLHEPQGC